MKTKVVVIEHRNAQGDIVRSAIGLTDAVKRICLHHRITSRKAIVALSITDEEHPMVVGRDRLWLAE